MRKSEEKIGGVSPSTPATLTEFVKEFKCKDRYVGSQRFGSRKVPIYEIEGYLLTFYLHLSQKQTLKIWSLVVSHRESCLGRKKAKTFISK